MKRILAVIALLAAFAFGQWSGSRFEIQAAEYHKTELDNLTIYAVHDKGSGMEMVCVYERQAGYAVGMVSCVPTGRNWK